MFEWKETHSTAAARARGDDCALCHDEVAEWLRRWTANPLGSARVGSNPILVAIVFPVLWCNG